MTTTPPSLNQTLFARERAHNRTRSICANYARYEAEKRMWASSHPQATSQECEQAMRAIANACGV